MTSRRGSRSSRYCAWVTSQPGGDEPMSDAERAFDALLRESHLAPQHALPGLVAAQLAFMGADHAIIYLVDLQQQVLVPFLGEQGPGRTGLVQTLSVDATVAGRAFQHHDVLTQAGEDNGSVRVWLPLLDGSERLGVLTVTIDAARVDSLHNGSFGTRLRRAAALVAELVMTKTAYGDTLVRLRRRSEMGLAAELQWSLLPPLTFSCAEVTVAGALEPAYQVAGDTFDYAVDLGLARAALFDGMGHGLRSSQLSAIAVAAYRNSRRSGKNLIETATGIHEALLEAFGGGAFTTGVLAELATETGVFSWINSGHPEPLLLRDGKLVKTLSCRAAPPLGLRLPADTPRAPFVVCREQLEPGDRIIGYTDGVTEARAPDGTFFGEQRLTDLLTRNFAAELPTPETLRRVVRALLEHQAGQLTDDATLLLIEWRTDKSSLLP
jgi:hypothetical protein